MGFSGEKASSFYDVFNIEDKATHYKLNVNSYHGDGGDGFHHSSYGYMNNGMGFSTYDQNHNSNYSSNCATANRGAWWWGVVGARSTCGYININGFNYGIAEGATLAMAWYKFGNTWNVQLKT